MGSMGIKKGLCEVSIKEHRKDIGERQSRAHDQKGSTEKAMYDHIMQTGMICLHIINN